MGKEMKIWFDREADFLEISMSNKKGFFKDVGDDVFERVDSKGNVIGFAIFNFTKKTQHKEKKVRLPFKMKLTH